MCCRRMLSSLYILNHCLIQNLLAEIRAQVRGRAQVYLPSPEQRREFALHAGHAEEAGCTTPLKLHQGVDVAIGTEIVAQRRAEHGQPANAMRAAERGDGQPRQGYL